MKKFMLVMVAAIMALGFSAFAPQQSSATKTTLYWRDDGGHPQEYIGDAPCDPEEGVCKIEIAQELRTLYLDDEFNFPVSGPYED